MAADHIWRRLSWLILGIGGLILAGGLALGSAACAMCSMANVSMAR